MKIHSISGFETCIEVPEYGIAFDMGYCPRSAVNLETVFISHTHTDHIAGLIAHSAQRDLLGLSHPMYVLPNGFGGLLGELFTAHYDLSKDQCPYEGVPKESGEIVKVREGRSPVYVLPYPTSHRVKSQGYIVFETRRKLKDSYAGMSNEELGKLARTGEKITVSIDYPVLAYTGDTKILGDLPPCDTLIHELTYIDGSVEKAREYGHTHIDDVIENVEKFKSKKKVIFTHFSAKYKTEVEIDRIIGPKLEAAGLRNWVAVIDGTVELWRENADNQNIGTDR